MALIHLNGAIGQRKALAILRAGQQRIQTDGLAEVAAEPQFSNSPLLRHLLDKSVGKPLCNTPAAELLRGDGACLSAGMPRHNVKDTLQPCQRRTRDASQPQMQKRRRRQSGDWSNEQNDCPEAR